MTVIGQAIREARHTAGLSLRDVERATNRAISGAGLSRIENGERYPTLRTLEVLSAVLPLRVVIDGGKTRTARS